MKVFLDGYLPRLIPGLDFLCIKHEGKQDLEKSIPRKLRAFQKAAFVVVRDNDSGDCIVIKTRLQRLCEEGGRSDALIRIACQELEAWYLGVPETLADVYHQSQLTGLGSKAKYRNPDRIGTPSSELMKLVPEFRKLEGARRMGAAMPLQKSVNNSQSFRVFVDGVRRISAVRVDKGRNAARI
jgi:hypothetical protein